jgi:hypothetical protein
MFLKTTRQRQLEQISDEWKKKNKRKLMRASERASIVARLLPTSFFHCLYRLRLRSNYADAESFLVAVASPVESRQFHRSLRRLCWYTLLCLELLLTRYVGKAVMSTWVGEFSGHDKGELGAELIRRRWRALNTIA